MGLPRRAITLSFQYDAIRDRTADMSLARALKAAFIALQSKPAKRTSHRVEKSTRRRAITS